MLYIKAAGVGEGRGEGGRRADRQLRDMAVAQRKHTYWGETSRSLALSLSLPRTHTDIDTDTRAPLSLSRPDTRAREAKKIYIHLGGPGKRG